jgi:hypothetical protein
LGARSAELQGRRAAWDAGYGVTDYRSARYQRATGTGLILAERDLELAKIDETLTKELAKIAQLQAAEEAKAAAVAQAYVQAEAQRQAAIEATVAKERELNRAIDSELTAALAKAGDAIKSNVTDRLSEALQAGARLASSLSAAGSSVGVGSVATALGRSGGSGFLATRWAETELEMAQGRLNQIAQRWDMQIPADLAREYLRLQLQGGVGQTEIENALQRMGRENSMLTGAMERTKLSISTLDTLQNNWGTTDYGLGPGMYGYAEGGVVPGAPGQPQPAIVHGGEIVLNPAQQAGQTVIVFQVDGRVMGEAVRVPLQDMIRGGKFVVRAG